MGQQEGEIPVERVDLQLNAFTRRSGSVLVAHAATGLDRGLEPGEKLLIRDGEQHWVATVHDISFDLTETYYRVQLGAPVDATEAGLLIAEPARTGAERVDLSDVLALLREARSVRAERPCLAGARHR